MACGTPPPATTASGRLARKGRSRRFAVVREPGPGRRSWASACRDWDSDASDGLARHSEVRAAYGSAGGRPGRGGTTLSRYTSTFVSRAIAFLTERQYRTEEKSLASRSILSASSNAPGPRCWISDSACASIHVALWRPRSRNKSICQLLRNRSPPVRRDPLSVLPNVSPIKRNRGIDPRLSRPSCSVECFGPGQ